jgi:6-phosphogluconolactonase (cycloisomerase 2 family)
MKRYLSFSLALFLSAFLATSFLACDGGGGGAPPPAGVTITESGSPASTDVAEGGAIDTFEIVLNTLPSADVDITVTPDSQTDIGSGAGVADTLTFTSTNGTTPQTVIVTAFDDSLVEGAHTSTITHTTTSTDSNYNGITTSPDDDITVNIADNDTIGITITELGGSTDVAEGGATDTYTIVLNSLPAADVDITVTPDNQTDIGSGAGVAVTLTFTSTNGTTPQTVTVTAENDGALEGQHTSTIIHSDSVSTDPDFNGIPLNNVTVNITDNDRLAFVANDGFPYNVSVYTVDPSTGNLTELSGPPVNSPVPVSVGSSGPFAVAVHASGGFLYVANRFSDDISAFSIDDGTTGGTAGTLTELASSPTDLNGPQNPLSVAIDPSGQYLYTANIDTNNISAFSINTGTGALTEITGSAFSAGNGARSVAITPSGNYLYTADELADSVSAFSIDAGTGALTSIGSFSVATNGGDGPRSVAVDPTGQFLYTANRDSDNVSAFSIAAGTGALTEISSSPFDVSTNGGDGPRSLAITAGQFLYAANEFTADISAFTIDTGTGGLAEITGSPFSTGGIDGADGVYTVTADPLGTFLYATNNTNDTVGAFTINSNGTLSPVPATEVNTGNGPAGVITMGIILLP